MHVRVEKCVQNFIRKKINKGTFDVGDIEVDFPDEGVEWIYLIRNVKLWRSLEKTVKKIQVP
jgi:hypothetical protein